MVIGEEWIDEEGERMVVVDVTENDECTTIVSHTEEE